VKTVFFTKASVPIGLLTPGPNHPFPTLCSISPTLAHLSLKLEAEGPSEM
jgi:hypothetical protein